MSTYYRVIGRTGEVLAENLVQLPDKLLLCDLCNIPVLPSGTYAFLSEVGCWPEDQQPNDLWLNLADIHGLTSNGTGKGCCGPAGRVPNLLAEDGTLSAIEFSDCWGPSYARIPEAWYSLEEMSISDQDPVILVGVAHFNDRDRVLERAVGPNQKIAEKRLIESARKMADYWTSTKPKARALFKRMTIRDFESSKSFFEEKWGGWVTNKPC